MPTPIRYVREIEPQYGMAVQVSPLIRRVMANNPGPFTYVGTGTYLLGQGEVAVIDPGPDDPSHVNAVIAALEPGERITHLVVTHTHADHSPASGPLQERTGAAIYGFGPQLAAPSEDPFGEDVVVFGDAEADADPAAETGRNQGEGISNSSRPVGDRDFRPDVVLREGDVVEGSGWTLEAVHTPGHASNHLCYFIPEEGILCTGDHVMGWSTSVISPPDGNLGDYLASLQKLLDRGQDHRYLPTHGPPIEEPHALVRAYLVHRRERSQQILDALAAGPATIAELVPRLYADTSRKLWRGAAASTFAHLTHLRDLEQVAAEEDPPRRRSTWFLRDP